jgi:hypothetical protein
MYLVVKWKKEVTIDSSKTFQSSYQSDKMVKTNMYNKISSFFLLLIYPKRPHD